MLLQPEGVADLSGKYSPLHGHPLISTALQELYSLEVLLEGEKVHCCHTFDVEVFNERHLFEGLLDSWLKCSSRFVTPLHTSGLNPLAAILGTAPIISMTPIQSTHSWIGSCTAMKLIGFLLCEAMGALIASVHVEHWFIPLRTLSIYSIMALVGFEYINI